MVQRYRPLGTNQPPDQRLGWFSGEPHAGFKKTVPAAVALLEDHHHQRAAAHLAGRAGAGTAAFSEGNNR